MFGFDGSTKAIVYYLEQIKNNPEGEKLTHKEVRAYARLMLNLLSAWDVDDTEKIKFLLASMSTSKLPHYDRSFAAEQILKLIEKSEQRRSESKGGCF